MITVSVIALPRRSWTFDGSAVPHQLKLEVMKSWHGGIDVISHQALWFDHQVSIVKIKI